MSTQYLDEIVECCVILHNMIVEDEYDFHYGEVRDDVYEFEYDDIDGNIVRSLDFECAVTNPPRVNPAVKLDISQYKLIL